MRAAATVVTFAAIACGSPPIEPVGDAAPHDDRMGVLAFGGDVFLARFAHTRVDQDGYGKPLVSVADVFDEADLGLVNLEAVVSSRGRATPKQGERNSYLFRGRPDLVRVLTEAGVDVITGGNNHSGDYGGEAIAEQMQILTRAGIGYVGIGEDRHDAARYRLFEAGDVVVALLGADTTTPEFAAGDGAGTLFLDEGDPDHFVSVVADEAARAREYADVVLFTAHWGPNLAPRPTEARRELAAGLIRDAGVDGILGHSAHAVQGMEIIDGRPVIYDGGNLMLDYDGDGWTHKSALFRLELSPRGVEAVEPIPIRLHHTRTERADGETTDELLNRFVELSQEFDPRFTLIDGAVLLDPPWEHPPPPARPSQVGPPPFQAVPEKGEIEPASVVDAPPSDLLEIGHRFSSGATLIGARPLPQSARRGHGFFVTTYWKTDQPIDESYLMTVRLRPDGEDGPVWANSDTYRDHHPGDWSYPTTLWEPGEIIEDRYFVRGHGDAAATSHELSIGLSSQGEVPLGDVVITD